MERLKNDAESIATEDASLPAILNQRDAPTFCLDAQVLQQQSGFAGTVTG
jgi:hypothetical protein